MATFKHISSKNADYGAAEQYLTFEHDEFTMKPTLDGNGRLLPRDDYRISSLNCCGENFAIACMQDDAEMKVDFGREIETDKILLYTRADFPHDNWWRQVKLEFSDGSVLVWDLEKSIRPHEICFAPKKITWLRFYDLLKADDPSPFPALSQIEVYGRNV